MDKEVKKKVEEFFLKQKLIKYKKGGILIRADDPPLGIFYLKEGLIKEYASTASGEELTLNIYKPPSLFPLAFAINNTIPARNFEATVDSILYRAPKEEILMFLKREPEVMFDLVSRIYRGLEGFFKRVENLMAGSAQARLIAELIIYSKRFGIKQSSGVLINLKLTHKDLSEQTGIARETIGRILKRLKNNGFINFKKRKIFIKNLEKLEELSWGVL